MPRILLAVAAILAACCAAVPVANAGNGSPRYPQEYKSLDLAPDGLWLAMVEPVAAAAKDVEPRGPVVVRSVESGRVVGRFDPCPHCRYSGLAWSPNSSQLAFLATDDRNGHVMLESLKLRHDAGKSAAAVTLTTITGIANTPRWSPDGSTLAFLVTVGATKKAGAVEAGAPQIGEIGVATDEQRLAVIPSVGGAYRLVSPGDTYVYEYDWLSDGRGFVAIAAKGNGDNNWWVAELDTIDLDGGSIHTIARPEFQISMPKAAPDGKSAVFIGGLMSDFGSVGGEVYQVPLEGGTLVSLTPAFRGSFMSLAWRGGRLYATALVVDRVSLLRFDDHLRDPEVIWSSPVTAETGDDGAGEVGPVVVLSATADRAATVVEDFGHAPNIIAGPVDRMRPITRDNDALEVPLEVRSITWTSDGNPVQGWLVGPAERMPGKRYPMIVQVHGGPSWAVSPSFGRDNDFETPARVWVARGYYVFLPNARGSYGQGEAFTRANIRDFGGGDLRDILAGVDAALKAAPIDDARLGIFGHSYGGFMTMWAVTHTHRFKAAVAGAGISNWISYYGENGIDQWMIPFFGASAYDDPAIYRAASPIESIKQVRTPTLIYVGERDVECPPPQSFEFWHALRALGVPAKLVVYPGAGHWIRAPRQVNDLRRRVPEWFDHYLAP